MKSNIPMDFGDKLNSDFSFSHQKGNTKYECAPHWHDCFEIFLVRGDPIAIILADGERILSAGDIAVFVPRSLHGVKSLGEHYDNYVFGYTEELIYSPEISSINTKYLAPFRYGRVKSFVIRADTPASLVIRQGLDALQKISHDDNACCELLGRSEVLRIHAELYKLSTTLITVNAELNTYLMQAEAYIRGHVNENITPHDVADALHVSYSHLARLLKSNLASSTVELINRIKISAAEQMMATDKDRSITDIALSLGYSSPSYFTRKFTEVRGQNPTQFRKTLKSL